MPHKDLERRRQYKRKRDSSNRGHVRQYRLANKDEHAAQGVAWRAEHPNYMSEYCKAWRAQNREYVRAADRKRKALARVAITDVQWRDMSGTIKPRISRTEKRNTKKASK